MREIKFRGKHIHVFNSNSNLGDRWVYGYLCSKRYIYSSELEGEMLVDESTVGQYTGLKDKNGKEIYEGDILNVEMAHGVESGPVFYQEDSACFEFKLDDDNSEVLWYQSESFEVIGNIYENPELLVMES